MPEPSSVRSTPQLRSHDNAHPKNLAKDEMEVHRHINLGNNPDGPTICFRLKPKGRFTQMTSHDAAILAAMLAAESQHEAKRVR